MKTLLISPPFRYITGSAKPAVSLPLGLLYIAAVLKERGHDVEVYDAKVNLKDPVKHTGDGAIHMGDNWREVEEKIAEKNPDIVGINCSFTAQCGNVIKVAQIVKKIRSDILVVAGGNHASAKPQDFFLGSDAVDIVCVGEGEFTMLDIVERFKRKETLEDISGTVFKLNGKIKTNKPRAFIRDLDKLPFPAYGLINIEDYFLLQKRGFTSRPVVSLSGSERAVSVITSRGCPFDCVFCSIHLHMGKNWRYNSSEYVVKHLETLIKRYGAGHVHFEDDNLTYNLGRFMAVLRGLRERNISITWDTPNGLRIDRVTEEALREFKESGVTYLIFGVESGNQEVLDKIISKHLSLNKVIEVAAWCKNLRIDTSAFFVIGFPKETRAQMQDTINFALMLQKIYDVRPAIFAATPLPGTNLEKLCLEKGILKAELSADELARMTQAAFLIDTDKVKAGDLRDLIRVFYRKYKEIFIKNLLVFFFKHPQAFLRFILVLIKKKKINKQVILDILEYKNWLLRNF